MTKLLSFVVFVGFLASCLCSRQSYSGYEVIKVFAQSIHDLLFLQNEEVQSKLAVWDFEKGDENWAVAATFHVHPDLIQSIKIKLRERSLHYVVQPIDLQREIDNEMSENVRAQARPDDEWFDSYHTYEEIMQWLDEQAVACGSGCSTFSIGNSFQGRELKVLKMTGAPNSCQQKPSIWIDAGIHAREWISVTTNMYLLDRLIQEYETDPFVKQMRDTYDWYFLPSINPDGYSYTWTNDRLWRKTRQPHSPCVGTDANRNFDFQWMTIGASSNPCSETFAGPTPYSEPEAKAVADYVMTLNGSWELFITLHTYGQLWMTPWGYTKELPNDYNELARVGQAAVNTILGVYGKVYQMGSAANILYESSGTSRDWAKGVPKIPYVYTIELRDTNSFVLPPTEIRPTGREIWAALLTTVARIQDVKPGTCIS